MSRQLEELYYNPAHYAGYSATENLARAAAESKIDREQVTHWLRAQDAYTLHRPVRRKFPRLHYSVTNIDDVWEADLIELRNLKSHNDGYSYLLVIIDVFSKYVWIEPLRDKTSIGVTHAFERVLARSGGRTPVYLQSDKGKEFIGRSLQKFLRERNIHFRVTRNPDVKAAVVERFNRTLKERMWRYFTHKNTRRYIDVLQNFAHAYNHTRHSTIKMEPACVTRENARVARENLKQSWRGGKNQDAIRKYKYRSGDLVRISRAKATFEKGYEAKWSEEIFRIHRVLKWRKPHVYELSDLSGEIIDGIFYEQELTLVNKKNLEEEEFIVDKIIKSKGRGENKQFLVSWRGYPAKFNSWIPASNLTLFHQQK